MRGAIAIVLAVLIAGCSGGSPDEKPDASASSSITPAPSANLTVTPAPVALPGSQLGRTTDTPIVDLSGGSWSLTFDQQGIHQAVLRLQAALDPQSYSITGGAGRFTLAIFPLDTTLGNCTASTVNAIASGGLVGLNNTISEDLVAGDYFVVVHNEDMDTQFRWQVGDDDTEHELDVQGEATAWKALEVTAAVESLSFNASVKAGLQFLLAQGSATGPTQDSSLTHQVGDGAATCASGQDQNGLSPFGSTLRLQATLLSASATTWSGTYAATTVLPTPAPTVSAVGRVLVAPAQ